VVAAFAVVLAFSLINFREAKELQDAKHHTVATIANLANIPRRLQGVEDDDTIKILDELYRENLAALQRAPDGVEARRAQAVNAHLRAEVLRRQGNRRDALLSIQEALSLGTKVASESRGSDDEAMDQRIMGDFSITQGTILEDLGRADGENQRQYEAALAAYEQSQSYGRQALAKGDPIAPRLLWYSYQRSADLLRRLRRYEEALKAGTEGMPLIEASAAGPDDRPSAVDLARYYKVLADTLRDQGNASRGSDNRRQARRYRDRALEHYLKSQRLLQAELAHDPSNGEAQHLAAQISTEIATLQRQRAGLRRAGRDTPALRRLRSAAIAPHLKGGQG
jgi:tetratricopeptide (TPR) repeat protein